MSRKATTAATTPIHAAPPRPDPVAEIVHDAPERRQRLRKGIANTSPTHIPREMIPEGIDLQWVTDTVYGKPEIQGRQQFEINGWRPVTPDMFGGRFEGMFTPKNHKGEINVMGSVLMERPMELTLEARAEEASDAVRARIAAEAKLRGGDIEGISERFTTQHKTARAVTQVSREPGHIQVPE